uniref:Uncharacterized protein n=1 Tax=Cannabis sativa TaxID=3483 RepID=A0A803NZZ9_CANSA
MLPWLAAQTFFYSFFDVVKLDFTRHFAPAPATAQLSPIFPIKLLPSHVVAFVTLTREEPNVGDLVTIANYGRTGLIQGDQLVKNTNMSKVTCPNAQNKEAERKLQSIADMKKQKKVDKKLVALRPSFPFPVPKSSTPRASTSSARKFPLSLHYFVKNYPCSQPFGFDRRLVKVQMYHSQWGYRDKERREGGSQGQGLGREGLEAVGLASEGEFIEESSGKPTIYSGGE